MAKSRRILMASVLSVGLMGCSATFEDHGYAPSDSDLDQVIVGVDTRETVAEVVGRPSAGGILADSGYYYVESRWRNFAYRAPEEIERQVVAISFDEAGVVQNVERFGLERGRAVVLSRRVTDSNIRGVSFLRQLLGNLGNIDAGEFLGGGNN